MDNNNKAIGLFFSVALHAVLVAALLYSKTSITEPESRGVVIEAQIIDVTDLSKKISEAPPKKNKPPAKKQIPQKKPEKKPEPKKIEEKKEPPPIKKKPEPDIDKKKIEEEKKKQLERQKKLEEIRKKRQELEEKTRQHEKKLKDIENTQQINVDDNSTTEVLTPGNPNSKNVIQTLKSQYVAAIKNAVDKQWQRPISAKVGLKCQIKVNQIPGGMVVDVTIGSPCNTTAAVKTSIINAVKKAEPLPFSGFESVFDRRINFTFEFNGD